MSELNDLERYLVLKTEAARKLVLTNPIDGDAEVKIGFGIKEIIDSLRNSHARALNDQVDQGRMLEALNIPKGMLDPEGMVISSDLLLQWLGASSAPILIKIFAERGLPTLVTEKKELKYELDPPINIQAGIESGGDIITQNQTHQPKNNGRLKEATIEEVLGDTLTAFKYAGIDMTNHTHYALNDRGQTHVIDLHDYDLRIVVTNKMEGASRKTYIIKTNTGEPLKDGIVPSKNMWESYPDYIGISKLTNHSIRLAQTIKRLVIGESYDGCVTIDGQEVTDHTTISDALIKGVYRANLGKRLNEDRKIEAVKKYDEITSPNVYKKTDILKKVAELLNCDVEDLDKLKFIKIDENGIGQVETKAGALKVIYLVPLSNKLGFESGNGLANMMKREGVEPVRLARTRVEHGFVYLHPYEEAIATIKEKLFGMDPFKTELISLTTKKSTVEIDGTKYVAPEVDLLTRVAHGKKRGDICKQIHRELNEQHKKGVLALVRSLGILRLYPEDKYRVALTAIGIAA